MSNARKICIAASMAVALALVITYWRMLPHPLFQEPLSTVVLDRNGGLLGARIASDGQWRFPGSQHAPEKFSRALIAYEDRRFFNHPGIDPIAIARAAYSDVKARRVVSGGSTLTMQLARRVRNRDDRGIVDKLLEVLLATRLEVAYDKQQILALYAAHAPFGANVVGLDAAAWRYFGRSANELSWAEACTLAVLPNSPALVHPGRNRTALLTKRNRLLRKLHDAGSINDLDLQLALQEPLPNAPRPLPNAAPHLLATLQSQSRTVHRFATTIDRELQLAANEIVQQRAAVLATQDVHNAAAIIIDNRTFEVLAYVGNAQWSVNKEHGFAVDIVRRPRSTGSVLKPFLYAAMLQSGDILPHTLVADVPTQIAGYMPENFDREYRGLVPADVALAQSLNVPAVRMLRQYGVQRFYDVLQHAGMSTLIRSPDDYGLTLILGGAEGTLWDISNQYANLAHVARQIYPGQPIVYQRMHVLRNESKETTTPADVDPASAWLTLNALLQVARPADEAGWRSFANARSIAWKTGTSWGLRDAWAIGNTSRYTVGVWVGNADGEGKPGLTGSVAAAPLMFALMERLPNSEWFVEPTLWMKRVEVCRNDGFLANDACDSESELIPKSSHFDRISPYNIAVHLDAQRRYRVDSSCEQVDRMQHENWFALPPGPEFYFKKQHANYRSLPTFRAGCAGGTSADQNPMEFLYPNLSTRLYIPIDFNTQRGRTVFEAVHRDPNAVLHWHLDDRYVGETRVFHQQALDISPGVHVITIVDDAGHRLSRRFEVLGKDGSGIRTEG